MTSHCLPDRLPDRLPNRLHEFRYAELALKIEAEPNFEAKKALALFGLAGSSLNTARTGGSSPLSLSPARAGSPQRTQRSPVGTHRSSAEFMEPGELAEEGEGPVGKGPVEGEGAVPVGIAAPEATPVEAAEEEAKAAEEAAKAAEEAAEAAEEAAAEEEEEELVFLALAPSRAPGEASTSTLRNDEETRARVRALTTAPCPNGSPAPPCMHAPACTCPPRRPVRMEALACTPCMHALACTCSPRRPVPVPSPQVHALFESMDKDGSGHVSRKELAAKLHADGESPFAPSRTPQSPPHRASAHHGAHRDAHHGAHDEAQHGAHHDARNDAHHVAQRGELTMVLTTAPPLDPHR